MRSLLTPLLITLLLAACSSAPQQVTSPDHGNPFSGGTGSVQDNGVSLLSGDFAGNSAAQAFVTKMVNEHVFDRVQLEGTLSATRRLDWVLDYMERQAPSYQGPPGPNGAWLRYRKKFITPDNVQNGVQFWNQYQEALDRAWQTYGVPPEIIVGIIGVETRWGRVMGKTRIVDALATLAFDYPRRGKYFASELETFLLMARKEGDNVLDLRGSFAGAMGYGQFMPSSYQQYAVDFNHDGHVNLWDPIDAIGSVAHYFSAHGWQPGGAVAIAASGQVPRLVSGFNTRYLPASLIAAGLTPQGSLGDVKQVSLIKLDMGDYYQYWFGLPNFYVITRYNHNTHYAMAVWQLGLAVRAARNAG
ncbi:murein transglycosylase B [Erwinia sp. OLTSP20]|uniref:lytic murein transglycosylase B n=1 Tax=unclassified Erwinia TaxID=2622719 RepID=UPI000C196C30|nr:MULTISPECIES: lytic murein transglycosylase B [unclassified Erwinia]PIJ50501.1 murein transglycosylase B [Erwinia sp. OAMSP11]PIJ72595.1 murein transglycosylase B [Erwinia sp. OLSSP12]PIJ82075.1 murein transglycosylase B [Erwinia sp. OLCASP19]PIJ84957.1 murein transglycosylase B [Erwinia sp. OLMTSP26]PIJ86561.1 murein transglycosylase B [Erwinia sp. OLMDSP33]